MRVLLIHQNFPGQFLPLAEALLKRGHQVVGIGSADAPRQRLAVRYVSCGGNPNTEQRHGSAERRHLAQMAQGRRVAKVLAYLAREPWIPNLIFGHPAWGDLLFLDTIFPALPLVALMEFDPLGVDLGRLDPPLTEAEINSQRADQALRSWTDLVAARRMVAGLTATHFQRDTYPLWLRGRIQVMHEGVDSRRCQPDPLARLALPNGPVLRAGDPVISFSARFLEPLRGFLQLMRAIPMVQRALPQVRFLIVGREAGPGYGPGPPGGVTWKARILKELAGVLDLERIHFCGLLPHAQLVRLFQLTTAHVYLSYPYVLSWSLLEAMASGALVIGSNTPAVREVLEPQTNGLLVELGDAQALGRQLIAVLRHPAAYQSLRMAARRTVLHHYEREACMERQISWLNQLATAP